MKNPFGENAFTGIVMTFGGPFLWSFIVGFFHTGLAWEISLLVALIAGSTMFIEACEMIGFRRNYLLYGLGILTGLFGVIAGIRLSGSF